MENTHIFSGNALVALDEEGRVRLPPFILREMERHDGGGRVIFGVHEKNHCLTGYGSALRPRLEAELQRLRLRDEVQGRAPEEHHARARHTFGLAEEASYDEDGQLLLPALARRRGGLGRFLLFVGAGDHFEIWDLSSAMTEGDEALRYLAEYRLRSIRRGGRGMSLLCALGGHEAGNGEVYNGGYYFAHCRRCGRDMIKSGGDWQMVPSGHRVVWRKGRHEHSVQPSFAGVMPVLHREANLPAVRPPFASWSREIVRLWRAPAASAAAAASEKEEPQYPRLLIIAALIGAGLELIFGLGSGTKPRLTRPNATSTPAAHAGLGPNG
jgi:MraZ protein